MNSEFSTTRSVKSIRFGRFEDITQSVLPFHLWRAVSMWTVQGSLERHKAKQRAASNSAGCCIHFAFIVHAYFLDSLMDESHNVLREAGKQPGENGSFTWAFRLFFSKVAWEPIWRHWNESYFWKIDMHCAVWLSFAHSPLPGGNGTGLWILELKGKQLCPEVLCISSFPPLPWNGGSGWGG